MKKIFSLPIHFFFSLLVALCFITCFGAPAIASEPDPDRHSGDNKEAVGATLVPLNGADDNGKCSYDRGDRTDWYKIYVDQQGILEVLVQNRIEGNLELEVYRPEILTEPETQPFKVSATPVIGNERVKCLVEGETWYYLKVYAAQSGDEGDYSFSNRFHEPDSQAPQIIIHQSTWTTTETSLTLFGTVKDNSDIASVLINDENILASTEILNQEFGEVRSFSYALENLAFGKNPVSLSASDMSGNSSSPVEILVIREDPPPTFLITTPEQNVRVKDEELVVQGTVTDNEEVSRVLINGKDITEDIEFIARDQVIFSYSLTELQYGEQEIVMTAEDNQGQQSQQRLSVYRDAPPSIKIDFPQENAEIQGETVDVIGAIKDDGQLARILINHNALSEHNITSINPHEWEFTATISDLHYGSNTLTITAIDDFDIQTTQEFVIQRGETLPVIHITTPSDQERIPNDSIVVEGYAQDDDGLQIVTVKAIPILPDDDGTPIMNVKATPITLDSSGKFRHTFSELTFGDHDIVVTAKDIRDNQAQTSVQITKVDESAPSVSILGPEDGKTIPGTETEVTIQGTAKDTNNQISAIRINGQNILASSIILAGTEGETRTFSYVIEDLSIGDNVITIQAEDKAGNLSPVIQRRIIRQDPPPKILVAAPQEGTRFPEKQEIILEGRVEDNNQVSHISVNDQDLSDECLQEVATVEFLTPGQANFRYAFKNLDYGQHEITIVAEDDLGNQGRQTLTIYRDSPPEILHISPRSGEKTWGKCHSDSGRNQG